MKAEKRYAEKILASNVECDRMPDSFARLQALQSVFIKNYWGDQIKKKKAGKYST
jgi:hypothetical protein